MDGRGGCCIARYGGCGDSKMDRIMLRFRPIAPKPSAEGSKADDNSSSYVKATTTKRKRCTGTSSSKRGRKRKDNTVKVTLPLLPETPDLRKSGQKKKKKKKMPPVLWLSFDGSTAYNNNNSSSSSSSSSSGDMVGPEWTRQQKMVGTWVIVESVTDTWGDAVVMMGRTDEEKRRRLEEDTCPAFISDCWNRVWWTNQAYRKMARGRSGGRGEVSFEEGVVLVMRDKPLTNCEAFTCRVTVQSRSSTALRMSFPCDVWRLSDGGFAWRLDVKAALSLGR